MRRSGVRRAFIVMGAEIEFVDEAPDTYSYIYRNG